MHSDNLQNWIPLLYHLFSDFLRNSNLLACTPEKNPWLSLTFSNYFFFLTYIMFPWPFPDFCLVRNFPDFSLTIWQPKHVYDGRPQFCSLQRDRGHNSRVNTEQHIWEQYVINLSFGLSQSRPHNYPDLHNSCTIHKKPFSNDLHSPVCQCQNTTT